MKKQVQGAKFYKADFHVHTPASQDVKAGKITPADYVSAAEKAEIELLAITDHNSAGWIDQIRTAAKKSTVTIIPGTEITTPEGHFIALFDVGTDSSIITDLLVEVGIPRTAHGKEAAISTMHAEDVIKKVSLKGGIIIAAHANSTSGLLQDAKGQYKLATFPLPELLALELGKQDEIERFCAGKVSKDYPPKACIQCSDSHAPKEIGRRITYLKMDEPSLYGIRQALLDYEVRIRFPWNYSKSAHPRILKLTVDQGFFKGEEFDFHASLNCLIGGKGTGKSTVIELLRYGFDDVSDFKNIEDDNKGKVASLVGNGGSITIEYLDSDGIEKIVRREVQSWKTEREVKDREGNADEIITPPTFFSQGELVQIAANEMAQMDLLDERIDISIEDMAEADTIDALDTNATELGECDRKIKSLRDELNDLEHGKAVTEVAYKKYEQQLKDPILKEIPVWEAEQKYLTSLDKALNGIAEGFQEAVDGVDIEGLTYSLPAKAPNEKKLKKLSGTAEQISKAMDAAKKLVEKVITEAQKNVRDVRVEIEPLLVAKRQEYTNALIQVGAADIKKATEQFTSLGRRMEALRTYEEELDRRVKRMKTLESSRKTLLIKLNRTRKDRLNKRNEKANEYQKRLKNVVSLSIVPNGDRTSFEEKIQTLATGSRSRDNNMHTIAYSIDPHELVELVLTDDSQGIADKSGVPLDVASRLVSGLKSKRLEELYQLDTVSLVDLPEIAYVFEDNRTKPLRELSTGQKGTVILSLAMVEEAGPLVVDQPEEPLDTESIYGQVVTTLRKNKEERQFIFTTHNANVAVGADADLSHVLSATADKGTIQSSGSVDHVDTNKLLLVHLEGGQIALDRRVQKYRKD